MSKTNGQGNAVLQQTQNLATQTLGHLTSFSASGLQKDREQWSAVSKMPGCTEFISNLVADLIPQLEQIAASTDTEQKFLTTHAKSEEVAASAQQITQVMMQNWELLENGDLKVDLLPAFQTGKPVLGGPDNVKPLEGKIIAPGGPWIIGVEFPAPTELIGHVQKGGGYTQTTSFSKSPEGLKFGDAYARLGGGIIQGFQGPKGVINLGIDGAWDKAYRQKGIGDGNAAITAYQHGFPLNGSSIHQGLGAPDTGMVGRNGRSVRTTPVSSVNASPQKDAIPSGEPWLPHEGTFSITGTLTPTPAMTTLRCEITDITPRPATLPPPLTLRFLTGIPPNSTGLFIPGQGPNQPAPQHNGPNQPVVAVAMAGPNKPAAPANNLVVLCDATGTVTVNGMSVVLHSTQKKDKFARKTTTFASTK